MQQFLGITLYLPWLWARCVAPPVLHLYVCPWGIGHFLQHVCPGLFCAHPGDTGEKKFLIFTGPGHRYWGSGDLRIGQLLFLSGAGGIMLGASGALYGILMAFGMIFPNPEIMLLFP